MNSYFYSIHKTVIRYIKEANYKLIFALLVSVFVLNQFSTGQASTTVNDGNFNNLTVTGQSNLSNINFYSAWSNLISTHELSFNQIHINHYNNGLKFWDDRGNDHLKIILNEYSFLQGNNSQFNLTQNAYLDGSGAWQFNNPSNLSSRINLTDMGTIEFFGTAIGSSTTWKQILLLDANNNKVTVPGSLNVTGNLGIGIANPKFPLDVNGDIRAGWIRTVGAKGLYSGTYGIHFYPVSNYYWRSRSDRGIQIANKAGQVKFSLYHNNDNAFGLLDKDGQWSFLVVNDQYTSFRINNSEKLKIKSDGNVGIGTSNPGSRLHVSDNKRTSIKVGGPSTSSSAISDLMFITSDLNLVGGVRQWAWSFRNDKWSGNIGDLVLFSFDGTQYTSPIIAQSDGDIILATGVGSTGKGNVGIGTITPTYKLDVEGTINATSILQNGQPIVSTQWENVSSGINFSTGNIGIGVTDPEDRLEVDGTVVSEEIRVEVSNVPDYVFKDDYELFTLEELETFIHNHHHLPEISPSSIMETNGVKLGEMNMKLLQKIEELTLYIIEQNKVLISQEKRIRTIEEKR